MLVQAESGHGTGYLAIVRSSDSTLLTLDEGAGEFSGSTSATVLVGKLSYALMGCLTVE